MSEAGCLVVVSGLPGSGKTTAARKLQATRPGVRFCPDEWMTALGSSLWDGDERERLRSEAAAVGARTELLYLDVPVDVLWARIVERGAEDPPMRRADLVAMYDFEQGQRPHDAERRAFDTVLEP